MKTRFTKTKLASLTLALAGAMLLAPVGCSSAPNTVEGMTTLENQARTTMARIEPTLPMPTSEYAGYVVFPDIGEGAAGIGGAYGKGVVYEKGVVVGYTDVTIGTLGWQLGGQTFKEIIVFTDPNAFHRFKEGTFEFDAKAAAIASDAAAGVSARTLSGATVYTLDKDGLMFAAAVGGQKFEFVPKT
jgi:lipid-binding SYLF domain-containing protein